MKAIVFFITCLLAIPAFAQCPSEGRSKSPNNPLNDKEKALNRAKNRSAAIPPGSATYWDISEVIHEPKHDDRDEFNQGDYVYVEGYLITYTPEGGESCNCYLADHNKTKYGDIHIYIGLTKNAKKQDCIVVEITPKYKNLYHDYLSFLQQAKGTQVRVFGYLLYDYIHERNSANFCTTCTTPTVWRKTCWEVHPIVAMEQL